MCPVLQDRAPFSGQESSPTPGRVIPTGLLPEIRTIEKVRISTVQSCPVPRKKYSNLSNPNNWWDFETYRAVQVT